VVFEPNDLDKKARRGIIGKIMKGMKNTDVKYAAAHIPEKARKNLLLGIFEQERPKELKSCGEALTNEGIVSLVSGFEEAICIEMAPVLLGRLPQNELEKLVEANTPKSEKVGTERNRRTSDPSDIPRGPRRPSRRLDSEGRHVKDEDAYATPPSVPEVVPEDRPIIPKEDGHPNGHYADGGTRMKANSRSWTRTSKANRTRRMTEEILSRSRTT
jgi:hypothetical protein